MPQPLPSHADILARVRRYREVARQRPSAIEPPGPGQESVWDYPRPPRLERLNRTVSVAWRGETVAEGGDVARIVETSGAPVYYLPPDAVRTDLLQDADHVTLCEWKGAAVHYDLVLGDARSRHAVFAYPEPLTDLGQGYEAIAGWFAFYPSRVDECRLDGANVEPQPGGFYAGWVTPDLAGPIKGAPGTEGW
ncbi:MAG: DUF427 domain-containing protein [Pseudomonadota bacterium]